MGLQTGMGTFMGKVIRCTDLPLGEKYFSGRGIWDGSRPILECRSFQGQKGRLLLVVTPTGAWE